jgi:hypothetical protein
MEELETEAEIQWNYIICDDCIEQLEKWNVKMPKEYENFMAELLEDLCKTYDKKELIETLNDSIKYKNFLNEEVIRKEIKERKIKKFELLYV